MTLFRKKAPKVQILHNKAIKKQHQKIKVGQWWLFRFTFSVQDEKGWIKACENIGWNIKLNKPTPLLEKEFKVNVKARNLNNDEYKGGKIHTETRLSEEWGGFWDETLTLYAHLLAHAWFWSFLSNNKKEWETHVGEFCRGPYVLALREGGEKIPFFAEKTEKEIKISPMQQMSESITALKIFYFWPFVLDQQYDKEFTEAGGSIYMTNETSHYKALEDKKIIFKAPLDTSLLLPQTIPLLILKSNYLPRSATCAPLVGKGAIKPGKNHPLYFHCSRKPLKK